MLRHNPDIGRPHRHPGTQLYEAFRQPKYNEALVPYFISVKAWAYTEITSPDLSQSLQRREFVNETGGEHYGPCHDRYIRSRDLKQSIGPYFDFRDDAAADLCAVTQHFLACFCQHLLWSPAVEPDKFADAFHCKDSRTTGVVHNR